ncbi:GntR family transcriptional regulator [Roseiconus lacunae]|uniref:GntR family transcriptional regulator n=1 Tax=Roseiconus lacunae TaxID=2605694 RepID=A0ABT7PCA3_9BACT|nr:GntR family transcriptional regulator [Roseiconus lacunae]MCD0463146.1 GntR family transcriptional regulator [Roseiconus lacunae]MDM4014118.1 GntR family transcriptional regulator [Roseiconus lacunae]WRQ53418.1 GntR family transcriptional regulator [Stieleria sp. HD01]
MFFSIDVHSDVAIYLQLVRQVKFAVAAGTLRPGQLLPSVRVLSNQVALNPNTVARAFNHLQSDGVIESLRGRGMIVRDDAVEACRQERETVLDERIGAVLSEAWNAGLSKKQIKTFVDAHLRSICETEPAVLTSASESGDNGQSETLDGAS